MFKIKFSDKLKKKEREDADIKIYSAPINNTFKIKRMHGTIVKISMNYRFIGVILEMKIAEAITSKFAKWKAENCRLPIKKI